MYDELDTSKIKSWRSIITTKSASLVLQPLSGMTKYRNAEQEKCAYEDPTLVFIANREQRASEISLDL
jgi:hypothetical protein